MSEAVETNTPNDILAATLAGKLVEAGLIPDSKRSELLTKLRAGGVAQEDWGLWIDLATTTRNSEGGDNE